jgi:hypothetical protein
MTERGIIAGQHCEVEYLDAGMQPTSKAEAVLVRLTFSNGELVMRRVDLELTDAFQLLPAAGS